MYIIITIIIKLKRLKPEPAVLGENDRSAFQLVLFSSHTVSVSDLHASRSRAQTVEPLCFRGAGLVVQARRLTDLNWFAQVSQVKGIVH